VLSAERAEVLEQGRLLVPYMSGDNYTHTPLSHTADYGSFAGGVALQNGGNVPGTIWHGSITRLKSTGECSQYPEKQTLSLQLTAVPYVGSLTLVGANNYAAYSSDYTSGSACVVQSGFTGNWYAGGSLYIEPDKVDSDYSACSSGAPAQPYGFSGTYSAGWKSITAKDSMECLQFSLSRVPPSSR